MPVHDFLGLERPSSYKVLNRIGSFHNLNLKSFSLQDILCLFYEVQISTLFKGKR